MKTFSKIKFFIISILLLSSACHSSSLRSLERSLGVSNLTSFKRVQNQERWELTDNANWDRAVILKDLSELGFVNAIKPKHLNYHTAVLLGATGPRMQSRIDYLIKTWKEGVRFKRIVFLTGDRTLSAIDGPSHAKNETELFKQLWGQADLTEDLKKLPALWIDAPKIDNKRPTTLSTIQEWRRQEDLSREDVLAFSNQPLVRYQECVLLNYMPQTARIEAVGSQAEPNTLISVYVNALVDCQQFCH